jgi:hypothetical protein
MIDASGLLAKDIRRSSIFGLFNGEYTFFFGVTPAKLAV